MAVVCITGMHRSGTSMVARMLNIAGLYLGPDADMNAAAPDNPEGYWENVQFLRINDDLLSRLKGGWDKPPQASAGWERRKAFSDLNLRGADLVQQFRGNKAWGWKDPRNALTLPFWQRLLPDLKVIICLRNPLEVARSLSRRGLASNNFSFDLWQAYNERLLAAVASTPYLVTHYNSYFIDSGAELRRLLKFVGLPINDALLEAACAAASTGLRHDRSTLDELIAAGSPGDVSALYVKLCALAGPVYWSTVGGGPQKARAADGREQFSPEGPLGMRVRLAENSLVRGIERTRAAQALASERSDKDEAVRASTENKQALLEMSSQLTEIERSRAWQFALSLRKLGTILLPPGSARSRLARSVFRGIAAIAKRIQRRRKVEADARLIRGSGLFDEAWYLERNPDVARMQLDPVRHYLQSGVLEGRDPNPDFRSDWYMDTYADARISGENPFVHYLKIGKADGRATQPHPQYEIPSQFRLSSGMMDMVRNKRTSKTAVILHLFYADLLDEITHYLQNLGSFDLYVSLPPSGAALGDQILERFPGSRILYAENRGRDILPFVLILKSILPLNYKYILKIHTKKTPHRSDGAAWRGEIYGELMGSPSIVASVVSAFEASPTVGMIGPEGHVIDYPTYRGANKHGTELLAGRAGIEIAKYPSFDFVAGSMFWARPAALRYLMRLPIQPEEFEPEPLEADGTSVHALERFIGLAAKAAGYSIQEVDGQGVVSAPKGEPSPDATYAFGLARPVSDGGSVRQAERYGLFKVAANASKLLRFIYVRRSKIPGKLSQLITNPGEVDFGPAVSLALGRSFAADAQSDDPLAAESTPSARRVRLTERLGQKLQQGLHNDDYVISISHDDYLRIVGGVQSKIADEQAMHNAKGISYMHLYPYTFNPRLHMEDAPFYVGISIDGRHVGRADGNALLAALMQLHIKKLKNIYIHHTMGFDMRLIYRLLADVGQRKGVFWLHDNFSLCPSYYLLRNDAEYCGAPDIRSNSCSICHYGDLRRKQQPAFNKLMKENSLTVVAPSRYTLDFWKSRFPVAPAAEKVLPHARLEWTGTGSARRAGDPLRIGFVGFPVAHKGWQTWLRLTNRFGRDSRYQFFLFSRRRGSPGSYRQVRVDVSKDDRLSMVTALRKHRIDVAFLWSLCPETFSFSLYESMAAGCYAITYKDSGNIQAYLHGHSRRGVVLENEEQLGQLFDGDDLNHRVATYQRAGRPQARLVFLPEAN